MLRQRRHHYAFVRECLPSSPRGYFFFVVWLSPICAHKYAQAYNLITDINLGTDTHTKAMRIPHPHPTENPLCVVVLVGGMRSDGEVDDDVNNFSTSHSTNTIFSPPTCGVGSRGNLLTLPPPSAMAEMKRNKKKKKHHQQPERCSIKLKKFQFLDGYVMQ